MTIIWFGESGGECSHWAKRLVSSLKSQALFNFIVQKLGVLCHICVAFDTWLTNDLDYLNAVIASINTANKIESAREQTVFQSFWAIFTGLWSISNFEVDADGSTKSPIASITVHVCKSACLGSMPAVYAHSCIVSCACKAEALKDFCTSWH